MKKAVVVIALLSQALGLTYADDQTGTRGIGQYPGRRLSLRLLKW